MALAGFLSDYLSLLVKSGLTKAGDPQVPEAPAVNGAPGFETLLSGSGLTDMTEAWGIDSILNADAAPASGGALIFDADRRRLWVFQAASQRR